MPNSPLAPVVGFVAFALVSSSVLANDVETYTEAAAAANAAPAADPAPQSRQAAGFFRWFRSSASKSTVVENETRPVEMPAVGVPSPLAAPLTSSELVANALGMIGVHYRRGGNTPDTGFDCSGLVRYVFQSAVGVDLPRRAVEISKVGAKVDRSELKPGDLVFYNTLKTAFSHVGIYLGDNRFIHAPSKGSQVRVEDMTQKYWAARFDGARRVAD